jgi:hypothetical protein
VANEARSRRERESAVPDVLNIKNHPFTRGNVRGVASGVADAETPALAARQV